MAEYIQSTNRLLSSTTPLLCSKDLALHITSCNFRTLVLILLTAFFRPYRVHQDGVKSSQVTGNEIVSVNTPYLVSKYTIANFSLVHTNSHIFYRNQTFRPLETSESPEWGTLGTFGKGCATGTLEALAYTRASSAEFCYPILD